MKRPALLIYGLLAYILFNITFVYFAGFLLEIGVPKGINDGLSTGTISALLINAGLVFLFGLFHSLMAREKFKRRWTQIVSPAAERSTYVLQATLFLALLMWQWRPMPTTLWAIDGPLILAVYSVFAAGVLMVLLSSFLINHFELFGLQQVWYAQTDRPLPDPQFVIPLLYRVVRHPMQLGVLMVLFSTPVMTIGHLFFAASMTLYIMIGLYFEERSLLRIFGNRYRKYQQQVPMLVPIAGRRWRKNAAYESVQ